MSPTRYHTALLCAPSPTLAMIDCGRIRKVTDGTRTRDLLLGHNPMPPIPARPRVSGNLAYLWAFRRFRGLRLSAGYSPLLARLQYGCSTVRGPQEGEGRLRTTRRRERLLAPVPDVDARGLERDSASRSVYRFSPSRHRGSSTHLSHLPVDPLGCV